MPGAHEFAALNIDRLRCHTAATYTSVHRPLASSFGTRTVARAVIRPTESTRLLLRTLQHHAQLGLDGRPAAPFPRSNKHPTTGMKHTQQSKRRPGAMRGCRCRRHCAAAPNTHTFFFAHDVQHSGSHGSAHMHISRAETAQPRQRGADGGGDDDGKMVLWGQTRDKKDTRSNGDRTMRGMKGNSMYVRRCTVTTSHLSLVATATTAIYTTPTSPPPTQHLTPPSH